MSMCKSVCTRRPLHTHRGTSIWKEFDEHPLTIQLRHLFVVFHSVCFIRKRLSIIAIILILQSTFSELCVCVCLFGHVGRNLSNHRLCHQHQHVLSVVVCVQVERPLHAPPPVHCDTSRRLRQQRLRPTVCTVAGVLVAEHRHS